MLAIDHLPFQAGDLARLARCFESLGFRVSPRGHYRSPDDPGTRWPAHGVFLADDWFDLLHQPALPAEVLAGPAACLLREGHDADRPGWPGVALGPPYELKRRWDGTAESLVERFSITMLRDRVGDLPLALIAHADPMADVDPAWRDHPNGAVAIAGFVVATTPPPARPLPIETMGRDAFDARYSADPGRRVAVRVRVSSLERAAGAIRHPHRREGDRLLVPPSADLPCPFAFSED